MSLDDSRQAGATEIDVTPAMIEAGMVVYWDSDIESDGSRVVLASVFRAMVAVMQTEKQSNEFGLQTA
jgi:hypothetical protein